MRPTNAAHITHISTNNYFTMAGTRLRQILYKNLKLNLQDRTRHTL